MTKKIKSVIIHSEYNSFNGKLFYEIEEIKKHGYSILNIVTEAVNTVNKNTGKSIRQMKQEVFYI